MNAPFTLGLQGCPSLAPGSPVLVQTRLAHGMTSSSAQPGVFELRATFNRKTTGATIARWLQAIMTKGQHQSLLASLKGEGCPGKVNVFLVFVSG